MTRALLLASVLAAFPAAAACIESPCFCFAGSSGAPISPGTVEAKITSVDGVRTEFTVETLQGTAPASGGGALVLPREDGDAVDSRWLIFLAEGQVWRRTPIDENGFVFCAQAAIKVRDARNFFESERCGELIARQGFTSYCKEQSCATTPGALLLGAFALIIRGRRSWSRSPRPSSR
ncbi:MAG: hypothetical protein QM817_12785 [Archangium sp.]